MPLIFSLCTYDHLAKLFIIEINISPLNNSFGHEGLKQAVSVLLVKSTANQIAGDARRQIQFRTFFFFK